MRYSYNGANLNWIAGHRLTQPRFSYATTRLRIVCNCCVRACEETQGT